MDELKMKEITVGIWRLFATLGTKNRTVQMFLTRIPFVRSPRSLDYKTVTKSPLVSSPKKRNFLDDLCTVLYIH